MITMLIIHLLNGMIFQAPPHWGLQRWLVCYKYPVCSVRSNCVEIIPESLRLKMLPNNKFLKKLQVYIFGGVQVCLNRIPLDWFVATGWNHAQNQVKYSWFSTEKGVAMCRFYLQWVVVLITLVLCSPRRICASNSLLFHNTKLKSTYWPSYISGFLPKMETYYCQYFSIVFHYFLFQLKVNCWFGLVVWNPGIPYEIITSY